jgi:mercuric ion binding protein
MRPTLLLAATLALAGLGIAPLSAAPAAQPPAQGALHLKTVTLAVSGMTCGLCPITVRAALQHVPGVESARADFATRTATVTFDPRRTDVSALTRATADAGYPSHLKK